MPTIREMVQDAIDAFNSGDPGETLRYMADDIELIAPGGIHLHGRRNANRYNRSWFEAFEGSRITAREWVIDGSMVALEATFTGRHTGTFRLPIGDFPPTGNEIDGPFAGIYRVVDGEFAYSHLYYDLMNLTSQLSPRGPGGLDV